MNCLADGEAANYYLEEKSESATGKTEDHLIDIISTEMEETIDFEKEGYEQVMTKGGLRWVLKKLSK